MNVLDNLFVAFVYCGFSECANKMSNRKIQDFFKPSSSSVRGHGSDSSESTSKRSDEQQSEPVVTQNQRSQQYATWYEESLTLSDVCDARDRELELVERGILEKEDGLTVVQNTSQDEPSSEMIKPADPNSSLRTDTKKGVNVKPYGRQYQPKWAEKYNWLSFDTLKNCVYCSECKKAVQMSMPLPKSSREKDSYLTFVENGFSNWKKALDRFQSHENSEFHRAAISMVRSAAATYTVSNQLDKMKQKDSIDSRHALKMIFTTLRYLAAQGIPIRGKTEEDSNFRRLIKLRASDSSILNKWINREEKYKWLSPEISNEILEIMAHSTLRKLVSELQSSRHFGVMLDETPDISCSEQISVCFRKVTEQFDVEELFFGFYKTESTTSSTLYSCLLDCLRRFDLKIKDCRGQCYDGAANMSGSLGGLQTLFRADEARCVFVHCRAHNLNLVAQDSINSQVQFKNVMDLVQSFVAFARGSPKRLACFSSFKAPDGVSLRPFCPTRWILRKPSITSITSNYSEIIKWLEDFDSHPENRQQRAVAAGYLKTFYKFDTFWKLELLRIIFTMVEDSNTALQSAQLNFRKAENVIKTLKDVIGRLRSSERFELLWDSAVLAAKAKRIDEPVLPRKRNAPARFNGNQTNTFPDTPKDHYNKIFYEIVDAVLDGLNSRFEDTDTSNHLIQVEDFIIGKCDVSHVKKFFHDDFEDYARLTLHRDIFVDQAKAKNVSLDSFQTALDFLKSVDVSTGLTSIVPEFVKLMKIVLTVPVSTCTAERSFSCLRRLKTYLRSTMTQERLNHLAILSCHSDLVETIDIEVLVDEFISRNAIRMNTFALSH